MTRPRRNRSESGRPEVGQRIELRRLQFGLSRRVVANLVGRSEEWLRLVESGRLRLDSVEVITRLADVLRIDDFRDLIDRPVRGGRSAAWNAGDLFDDLRSEMLDHPAIGVTRAAANGIGERPVSMPGTADALAGCERIWRQSRHRYSELAQRLPRLLAAARQTYWRSAGAEGADPLLRAYHLTREVLSGIGAHDLAWLAADRAMVVASYSDDPPVLAASAWQLSDALLRLDRPGAGRDYALAAVARLAPGRSDVDVLRGALQLLAATAAAAIPDPAEAERLLDAATGTSVRLGAVHCVRGIGFGPTEIGLARMEIALARNDVDAVLGAAAETEPADDCPVGRRARYHTMAAAAFAGRNDDMGAAFELAKAADAAEEDLRYDLDAHRTLRQLLQHDNGLLRRDLTRLAALVGQDGRPGD
ncbi:helix-turn-helix domain-containing protein [Nocardia mexicana]|uniref:Helix-turn-helix protein n=2 Tax=Nocardia mexicana TaxID=279262 RepID=A0A370H8S7_9NOCA|nr:helix-turn-helix transcriptional regulator [Nocardia mexicana]RDI50741.1 helix-turn-helix protein [Nocardia mexicana]